MSSHIRHGEDGGRSLRIAVVEENRARVLVAGDRERGAHVGELTHRARLHVQRVQLRRHLHAGVEVDRPRVVRPESGVQTLVEVRAQLSERRAAIAHLADVDAVLGHRVALHLVGRRKGDPAAVGGKAEAAFADLVVVREAFDPAGGHLHEVQVRVEALRRDVALVALGRAARDADPATVVGEREAVDAVRRIVGLTPLFGRRDLDAPQARQRRDRIADVDGEAGLPPLLLVLVEGVGAGEVDAASVGGEVPLVDACVTIGKLGGVRSRQVVGRQPARAVPGRSRPSDTPASVHPD